MADDEENDPTAPFNELESFNSIRQALQWKHIKNRIPICFKKTIRNRYFLANFIYLIYAIGILIIDFSPWINGGDVIEDSSCSCNDSAIEETTMEAAVSETGLPLRNQIYIASGVIHLLSATLYWWAWKDHRWNDIIMLPEYLNHIEASLYLWSAIWYIHEDGTYGPFTFKIHIIETVAAFVELFASFGWIMSWYRTYTRTVGRGYTLDDADTVAYLLTTFSSFIYITYNIQVLVDPEQYEYNTIYTSGDIIYFVGAVFYLWANLRDDGWLWWMPVAGQYGIAAGRIQTGKPVKAGLPHLLVGGSEPFTRCCQRCLSKNNNGKSNSIMPMEDKSNSKQDENRV